jgi:hypothetical protein
LGLPGAILAELAKVIAAGATGDRGQLASARIPSILDLDFQAQAIGAAGNESRTQGLGV